MRRMKTIQFGVIFVATALLMGFLIWRGAALIIANREFGDAANKETGVSASDADLMGLVLVDITTEDMARQYKVQDMGVYVLAMEEGSVANQAGIQCGDQIVMVNDRAINESSDIISYLQEHTAENEYTMKVKRQREERQLVLALPANSAP